ncbi:MAG: alpha/beta hydrolase [Hyphomicrobiales bacterium]|nr:alpha/beta hydrolase [Hyphomicrobiales bacterium]
MASDIAVSPELFAKSNGQTLCYQTFGDGRAPVILLIMGLGAQMTLWDDDFCAQLAGRGYRVVRFDNRDIGRSSKIDAPVKVDFADLIMKQMRGEKIESPYTLRDMAADACGLLDHLGISRAHVVGASMGGMITQEMAINFPDRMLSMTSIMSSTGNPALPPPTPEAAAVLMAPPPKSREDYIEAFAKTWKVLRAGSFPADESRDAQRAARTWERGLNPMGVARQMLAIFASGDRRAKLGAAKTPALVIHGDVDPLVRLAAGEDTAKSIPGSKLVVVKTMGHAIPTPLAPQIVDTIAQHVSSHA